MRALIIAVVVATAGRARADDRSVVVNLGAGFGTLGERSDGATTGVVVVDWEHAPVAFAAEQGYRFEGDSGPELVAGGLATSDRAIGYAGAGLRAELKLAQTRGGLLEITSRGAFYVAARGLIVGDQREPMIELALGEYLTRHQTWTRIGFELDLLGRTADFSAGTPIDRNAGLLFQLYLGFAP